MTPLLSVVIPARNEAGTIGEVLRRIRRLDLPLEVIVVDDGSTDGTSEVVRADPDVIPLKLDKSRGKGAAVRLGIHRSTGQFLIVQDADLEYDPTDIPRLLAPLRSGDADAVFGTRLRGGGQPQRVHLFWHYLGNRVLSTLTNILYNTTLSDMEVGYKAFRGDLVRSLHLVSNTFTIEPELTAKTIRSGARVYEVPISYYGRTYAEGKKIAWHDGLRAVFALFRFRVGRVFAAPETERRST